MRVTSFAEKRPDFAPFVRGRADAVAWAGDLPPLPQDDVEHPRWRRGPECLGTRAPRRAAVVGQAGCCGPGLEAGHGPIMGTPTSPPPGEVAFLTSTGSHGGPGGTGIWWVFDGPVVTGTIGWGTLTDDQTRIEVDVPELEVPPGGYGNDTPEYEFPPVPRPDIGGIDRTIGSPLGAEEGGPDCEALGFRRMALPDPDDVADMTKECFGFVPTGSGFDLEIPAGGYEWPETDCEAPCINPWLSCEPPDGDAIDGALLQCPWVEIPREFGYELDDFLGDAQCPLTQDQIDAGIDLIGAGVAMLIQNQDIVSWLTCLLESWSPDLEAIDLTGCVLSLLNGSGSWPPPMHVYVLCRFNNKSTTGAGYSIQFNPGPDGWQGPIIPIGNKHWLEAAAALQDENAPEAAICAAADMAAVLLHEMVHICGDTSPTVGNPLGATSHKDECDKKESDPQAVPTCCWDECRMIQRSMWWALAQRYPCLTEAPGCCDWADAANFMYSADGGVPGTPCS